MLKEIHEQAEAMERALEAYPGINSLVDKIVGDNPDEILDQMRNIHIVTCETSHNTKQIVRYR